MKLSRRQRLFGGFVILCCGIAYGVYSGIIPKEYVKLDVVGFVSDHSSLLPKIRDAWLVVGFLAFLVIYKRENYRFGEFFSLPAGSLFIGYVVKVIAALFALHGAAREKYLIGGWFALPPQGSPIYLWVVTAIWFVTIFIAIVTMPLISLCALIPSGSPGSVHKRGRELMNYQSAAQAAANERAKEQGATLIWGWLDLPWSFATKHFLACGSTGSGKTTLIRFLMQSVLPRIGEQPDERALIYDAKQDILSTLDGMNLTARMVLLNPFDSRSSAWDISKDVTEPSTAQQIASILIPEEKSASQPFFADAARHLMAGVMRRFIKTAPGNWSLSDVIFAMLEEDRLREVLGADEELKYLLTYLKDPKTGASVLATVLTKIQPYEFIAAVWSRCHQKVSLRDWVKGDYILILGNDEAQRTALDSINQAIFKRIVELILAEDNSDTRRTWVILDEVREAGKLDGLQSLLTKGRSKGAAVVLGFQDIDGLKEVYGEYLASEITGQCASKAFLRTDSAKTAEWGASLFGDREFLEVNTSESTSQGSSSGGLHPTETAGSSRSSTTQLAKRATVMPGQIMALPIPGGPGSGPMEGFYIAPNIGPYHASIFWNWIQERLIDQSNIPNLIRRSSEHERLKAWEDKDFERLGLKHSHQGEQKILFTGHQDEPALDILKNAVSEIRSRRS